MVAWHRTWKADLGLRVIGILFCALAYLACARLAAVHPHGVGVAAFALAATGFFAGSAGTAMALLGGHVFDEIEISVRWRTRDPAPEPMPQGQPADAS